MPEFTRSMPAPSTFQRLRVVFEMIKIEHTLFALPFALLGMMLAAHGWPSARVVGWILVAMLGARSAAMAFNRLVDRDIDARNPRTATRAIPAGLVSPGFVAAFVVASLALFFLACWKLNPKGSTTKASRRVWMGRVIRRAGQSCLFF